MNMRRNFLGCDLCKSRSIPPDLSILMASPCRTFVNGRNRDVIMEEMRQRIDRGDKSREIEENIQVSCSCCSASQMLISGP